MGNFKVWIIGILILCVGIFYVQRSKDRYTTSIEGIFTEDSKKVEKILIHKGDDSIELVKDDDSWRIAGNDTLVIRENQVDDFFTQVLGAKRSTVMTEKPDKWTTYSVDDSSGTHLTVVAENGQTVGDYVFGGSRSDWGKSYVRIRPDPNVYLTDNVIYQLSTSVTYWGEKPKPVEESWDSSGVETE